MVDTVEIGRVTLRDTLSLDLSVWMNHPDDWDFRPVLSYAGSTLTITCANQGTELATVDLDDEQDEALQRDRVAELRVKFQVHGMHGRLNDIHPIIADGKAKKLATANWKTTQPVQLLNPQRIFDNGSSRFVGSCLMDKERGVKNEHDSNDWSARFASLFAPTQVAPPKPSWPI